VESHAVHVPRRGGSVALAPDTAGQPFPDFTTAARAVLEVLQSRVGLRIWLVTRAVGDDQLVLEARERPGPGYGAAPGHVLSWEGSLCLRMTQGLGPTIAPRATAVEAYQSAPNRRDAPVEAYIGVPLRERDGSLFGTLCAFDPEPQPESLADAEDLVLLQASLLATLLQLDLDRDRQRRRAERAEDEALRDALTGCANRRAWDAALEAEEQRCRRYGHPAAVIVVDLNWFKQVNDNAGHDAGDALLRACARVLAEDAREVDVVARLGGDEFGVLLVETDAQGARARAERLRLALHAAGVDAALGLGLRPAGGTLPAAWRRADEDMYVDKRDAGHLSG
jgi:diguanylate cyclase (GGDEF)-like protein